MNHPFALNISDLEDLNLDFEQLTDEETAQIAGGETKLTTLHPGEEGSDPGDIVCISAPCPGSESGGEPSPKPLPKPPKPAVYTKAWFETGGEPYTKALHETGGPIYS
jgi:bacteriocin-like protein